MFVVAVVRSFACLPVLFVVVCFGGGGLLLLFVVPLFFVFFVSFSFLFVGGGGSSLVLILVDKKLACQHNLMYIAVKWLRHNIKTTWNLCAVC